jgi:TonB family protein
MDERASFTTQPKEKNMKHVKQLVGLASTAVVFLSLTAVSPAVTITLGPSRSGTSQALGKLDATSCRTPHTDAAFDGEPAREMPKIAEEQGVSGVSVVEVDLGENGSFAHTEMVKSSGDRWLDEAALQTARTSKYQAETRNCTAVGGSYLLKVDF